MSHFHPLLYGHSVTVYTDHSAVQTILDAPNPSGKHACWWTRVYRWGVQEVKIKYRLGKTNTNANALSCCPQAPAPEEGVAEDEFQVAQIDGGDTVVGVVDIDRLLQSGPASTQPVSFGVEQHKDPNLREVFHYLEDGVLPEDTNRA